MTKKLIIFAMLLTISITFFFCNPTEIIDYNYGYSFGSYGTGEGEFDTPTDASVSTIVTRGSTGSVFITDTFNHRIQEFTATGTFIGEFAGGLTRPTGITVCGSGHVIITDTYNNGSETVGILLKYDTDGNFITSFGSDKLKNPKGLAYFEDGSRAGGHVIITDTFNSGTTDIGTIYVYDIEGNYKFSFGSDRLKQPSGIAITGGTTRAGGHVIITDTYNNAVYMYDIDFNTKQATFKKSFGSDVLVKPYGVAHELAHVVQQKGKQDTWIVKITGILVTDVELNQVIKFDLDGNYVTSFGSFGSGEGQFNKPTGIYANEERIFVVDSGNHRVQVFYPSTSPIAGKVETPTFYPRPVSVPSGTSITISTVTSGATIYYTTNGEDPTTSSNVYSSAIPITTPTTFKAIAVKADMTDSDIATKSYTIQQPEINVKQGTTNIADETGSYDFGVTSIGGSSTATFTIENLGDAILNLTGTPIVSITGTNASEFSVTTQPTATLTPSSTTTFVIEFTPTSEGSKIANVSIANNDSDENPYNFSITAEGTPTPLPEIHIIDEDSTNIPNGGSYDFITTDVGNNSWILFVIQNTGTGDLNLTGTPIVEITGADASMFTVMEQPAYTTIAPSGSTTFEINFVPTDNVQRTAIVSIANDDSDENPYTFTVTGTGTYNVVTLVNEEALVGASNSITVDNNHKVHIAYSYYDYENLNSETRLRYITNISGSWISSWVNSTESFGNDNSITVDSNNKVHISYCEERGYGLRYATNESGTWVKSTIDSTGLFSSISIDSNDKIHITYRDDTNYDLKYATNESGSWVTSIVDSTGDVGQCASSVMDSNDKLHISYFGQDNLKYATNESGTWVISIVDPVVDTRSRASTSIAINSAGKIYITYNDKTTDNLEYATNETGSWLISTLYSSGNVGKTSIVIDSYDNVHIIFSDKNLLKYATNKSDQWIFNIIDSCSSYSSYGNNSIFIDGNKIHIIYYDDGSDDLKYAWWYN